MPPERCVILVGHGGIPSDCPPGLVAEFKRLEAASKGEPSERLAEADARIRSWPRTPRSDPYKPGLEAVAEALRRELKDRLVLEAYNEFCDPSLEKAMESAIDRGAKEVTVITTMYTRGGVHSEKEIPRILDGLRRRHPGVAIRYAWPFRLQTLAGMLASEVLRAESAAGAKAR